MISYLRIPLIFVLITPLTSFGFIAWILSSQINQKNNIALEQLYAVIAISTAASLCSLALIVWLGIEIAGKAKAPNSAKIINAIYMILGLVFCAFSAYSFSLTPTNLDTDFLLKFANGGRFEFLMIGVCALLSLAVRKRLGRVSSA